MASLSVEFRWRGPLLTLKQEIILKTRLISSRNMTHGDRYIRELFKFLSDFL